MRGEREEAFLARVEQAMKNWEGEKFQAQSARKICAAAPTIPVCPALIGAHDLLPSSRGHV